ncbi:ATP-grasp domain-containing protein [Singulisphaera rosea]
MTTPSWLIQADVFGRGIEPVKASIRRQGMAFSIVQPRPFLNGVVPDVGGRRLCDGDCVVFLGTIPLMRHIQIHHRWSPGGWCNVSRFDCTRYYPAFSHVLLNADCLMLSLEEAISDVEGIYRRFAEDGRVFIRPLGLEKTFTGRCVEPEAYDSALRSAGYSRCGVLVARPKSIAGEWRLVVGPRGVVAASRYRKGGDLSVESGCPDEVRSFVENALSTTDYRPDDLFMLDVCNTGESLHLLELNSFSCSGLYACDVEAVVAEAARLAIKSWEGAR